ncbi:MAG TPA: site-specific DNA-methyltransferase [Streptosporangiaceae bacterium]
MSAPYYSDGTVTLWLGDCRVILPTLGQFDCCLTDPPYGETSLAWDRWPDGWPALVADHTSPMWCFGSLRMFLDRRDEFAVWKLSQDVVGEYKIDMMVWEKHMGTGFAADRFKKVHELAAHWYRGSWSYVHHEAQREVGGTAVKGTVYRSANRTPHSGKVGGTPWDDDGQRLVRSVLRVANMRFRALHPTEKPIGILDPLIRYACPPGGTVLDPFAGSASTLVAARDSGRRAVGIEASEEYAERAARRLQQGSLFGEVIGDG